jgi:DHA3 family macrolide efflux protein-like MFS transporter
MSTLGAVASQKRRIAPFVLLEAASLIGFLGGSMMFMLFPWLAINLTGSATTAGLMVSIVNIPGLVLSPLMGSFIDRFGRRRSAILMEILPALATLAIPVIGAFAHINVTLLIIFALLRSIVGGSSPSARKSLIPDVATAAHMRIEKANSIHESLAAGGFAMGPFIASLLIGWIGAINTFYVVSVAGLVSALIISMVRVHEHKEANPDDEGSHWLSYAIQGFKITFQTPAVAILMVVFGVLAMIYLPTEVVLLPKFYNSINNPAGYGQLLGIMAAFTTVGSLGFDRLARRFKLSTILRFAVLGVAVSMFPMSQLPAQWVMLAFGVLLGLAWGPLPPMVNTVVQRKVPPSKRGRVFSLEMTIWTGGPMISMALTGLAVDAFGVKTVYIFIALAVLLCAILVSVNKATKDLDVAEFED